MKPDTERKFKFKALKARLRRPHYVVVGILESLWIFAADNAPDGDLRRFSEEEICLAIEYTEDPKELIKSLVDLHWLDRVTEKKDTRLRSSMTDKSPSVTAKSPPPPHKSDLIVHDWFDHCPEYVKRKSQRLVDTRDRHSVTDKSPPLTDKSPSVTAKSPPSLAQRSATQPSVARRRAREAPPARPPSNETTASLARRLVDELQRHAPRPFREDDHDARCECLEARIDELGPEAVEQAVRWWIDTGRRENPASFAKVLRYPDAFSVSGETDRLEQALRQIGDSDDEDYEPEPRSTVTDSDRLRVHFETLKPIYLDELRKASGLAAEVYEPPVLEYLRRHGLAETQATLERILIAGPDAPAITTIRATPGALTAEWLEAQTP